MHEPTKRPAPYGWKVYPYRTDTDEEYPNSGDDACMHRCSSSGIQLPLSPGLPRKLIVYKKLVNRILGPPILLAVSIARRPLGDLLQWSVGSRSGNSSPVAL